MFVAESANHTPPLGISPEFAKKKLFEASQIPDQPCLGMVSIYVSTVQTWLRHWWTIFSAVHDTLAGCKLILHTHTTQYLPREQRNTAGFVLLCNKLKTRK